MDISPRVWRNAGIPRCHGNHVITRSRLHSRAGVRVNQANAGPEGEDSEAAGGMGDDEHLTHVMNKEIAEITNQVNTPRDVRLRDMMATLGRYAGMGMSCPAVAMVIHPRCHGGPSPLPATPARSHA